jgi:hypothetical protein
VVAFTGSPWFLLPGVVLHRGLGLFLAWFFRDPERTSGAGPGRSSPVPMAV